MCHSSKHTASICIQDNQTCHENFILCLLALFVLSLFLALLPFVSPPGGNSDESSSHDHVVPLYFYLLKGNQLRAMLSFTMVPMQIHNHQVI